MTTSTARVVRLTPQNWSAFKAIRLEALRSEPAAFSSTYAETRARPDESWRQWLENPRCIVLLALAGERAIGIVGAYLGSDDGDASVAVVFGMYVNKQQRQRGTGRLLLTRLLDEVSAHPVISIVRLWVSEGQAPARRLYESLGFEIVGRVAESPGRWPAP